MPGTAPAQPPRPRPARRGRSVEPHQAPDGFIIDKVTLEHLPCEFDRLVAEALLRLGRWTLKNSEKKEVSE